MNTTIDVDAVLFDNDGVLSDSIASAGAAWDLWAATWAPDFNFLSANLHGVRAVDIVRSLVPADRLDQAVQELEVAELNASHDTIAIAGAVELTKALASSRWAVVSSGTSALLRARLDAAGIARPSVMVSADDVTHGKPHPEPYLTAARKLQVAPGRCAVIEDAPAGVQAARAAGVSFVVGIGEEVRAAHPDVVVQDLTALDVIGGKLTLLQP